MQYQIVRERSKAPLMALRFSISNGYRATAPQGEVMTIEQARALRAVADAIIEAVDLAGPMGAPAGVMYAALMASGITLPQFEQIMAGLCGAGKLRKQGHLYFVSGQYYEAGR